MRRAPARALRPLAAAVSLSLVFCLGAAAGAHPGSRGPLKPLPLKPLPLEPTFFQVPPPSPEALAPPPVPSPDAPGRTVLATNYDATDPSLVDFHGLYLLYTTGGGFVGDPHVVVHVGRAVGQWDSSTDALPVLPSWVSGNVWAPAVQRVVGGWALYFSAMAAGSDPPVQCIGAAFGPSPLGPFAAESQPFVCQVDHRGSIDPRTYVDADGSLWLDWKADDNADPYTPGPDQGGTTSIWAQQLSLDGHRLLGQPQQIFQPDQDWQGTIVESPDMIDVGGVRYLVYSGNWFNTPDYGIGLAVCQSAIGPCQSVGDGPLLGSNAQGSGPGEPSAYVGETGVFLLYTPLHAAAPDLTPPRPVAMARLGFSAFGPYLATW